MQELQLDSLEQLENVCTACELGIIGDPGRQVIQIPKVRNRTCAHATHMAMLSGVIYLGRQAVFLHLQLYYSMHGCPIRGVARRPM